MDALELLKQDH
jgi:Hemerythrin HHE cation binding domain